MQPWGTAGQLGVTCQCLQCVRPCCAPASERARNWKHPRLTDHGGWLVMHIDGAAIDPAMINIYVPLDVIGAVLTYRSFAATHPRQLGDGTGPHTPCLLCPCNTR